LNGIQNERRSPNPARNVEFLRRTAQKWLEIKNEKENDNEIWKLWENSVYKPNKPYCEHESIISATKTFDWLNGLEIEDKICVDCGKIMGLTIRAFSEPKTPKKPRRLVE